MSAYSLTPYQQRLVELAARPIEGFEALRVAGRITRYHNRGPNLAQRVDAHSWGVATLCYYLWPDASRELLLHALYHDVGEHLTGDIPSPTKWALSSQGRVELEQMEERGVAAVTPALPYLEPADGERLSIADALELMVHCLERMVDGDRQTAWKPFWNVADYLRGKPPVALEGRPLEMIKNLMVQAELICR